MADDRRLDGWKAIANFLGRDRSTVMRWTNERGLPVHRVPGGRTGTVFALREELSEWLARGGDVAPAGPVVEPVPSVEAAKPKRKWLPWLIAGLGLLVGLAIVAAIGMRSSGRTGHRTIGIAAATSSDDDAASRHFASELTADLARFANASAGLAVYDGSGGADKDVQVRLRTSIERSAGGAGGFRARMWLVAAGDGSVLWSRQLEQTTPEVAVLRERVAANVVAVARCAFSPIAEEPRKLSSAETALLLAVCQRVFDDDFAAALAPARELNRLRPDLALSWAALSIVQSASAEGSNDLSLARQGKANAERAVKTAPGQFLPVLALSEAQSDTDPGAFAIMRDALRRHPDEPRLLRQWSVMLFDAGYVKESVEPSLRASASDPTWLAGRDFTVRRLSASGRFPEAFALQAENERLWPGHPNVVEQRARLETDAKEAQSLRDPPGGGAKTTAMAPALPEEAYALARAKYRQGDHARALALLADAPVGTAALVQWPLLFWPSAAELRTEPAFFQKMAQLGLVKVWAARREWPDFCAEPGLRYDCAKEAAKLGVTLG